MLSRPSQDNARVAECGQVSYATYDAWHGCVSVCMNHSLPHTLIMAIESVTQSTWLPYEAK
jgi:hypothetical protein